MHGIAINQMEELLAVESREEERGWGEIRGWHYSTNCGNGSKVELSGQPWLYGDRSHGDTTSSS